MFFFKLKKNSDLVINLPFPKTAKLCAHQQTIKKKKENFPKGKKKRRKICKTITLTASIQPNNKDILQILLAITYFTSCDKKKSKIKDKKHKCKIDLLSLVFLKWIGKHVNVHSGLVFLFLIPPFVFSGWHLSSSDIVAVFFFLMR